MAGTNTRITGLLGSSGIMEEVRRFALRAARVRAPALLLGETGTGKSLLGRIIHAEGSRAGGPYLTVNCAGVPDTLFESEFFGHHRGAFTGAREGRRGLFEQAGGGTLFLDEVGELPTAQQAKLLMALEEGEVRPLGSETAVRVDVRILAATSRDLPTAMESGGFRRDLFHRLAVLTCYLPPLRDRIEDIPLLARRLLRGHARRHGRTVPELTPPLLRFLTEQAWPGNIRELSHLLEAGLIYAGEDPLTPEILTRVQRVGRRRVEEPEPGVSSLPDPAPGRYSFSGTPEEERELIRSALQRYRGNRTRAARELGMARNTLRGKLRKYGLTRERGRT